jgi:hypothetical protein
VLHTEQAGGIFLKSLRLKLTLVIFVATFIALGAVTCLNYSRASEILMAELSNAAAGSARSTTPKSSMNG